MTAKTVTFPVELGGTGTTYRNDSGTNGMAAADGYAYKDTWFDMINESVDVADGVSTNATAAATSASAASTSATAAATSASAASTSATAAATSASAASTSATAAATSASAASTFATAAATSATAADASEAAAQAAAEASGAITFYDTKAAATAAVGSLADLAVVEVLADESQGGARTRYRKQSGALVYKMLLPSIYPTVSGETGVVDYSWPVGDVRRYGVTPDGTTNWESAYSSRIAAIFANSCLAAVTVYWPPGEYATGLNLGSTYNGSKMFFDHAVFYNILHVIDNVTDVSWLGTVSSYDRLGTIGSRLRFGTVKMLNDSTKNPQGTGNRGVHVLGGEDVSFDSIVVDNTGATSATLPGAQTIWAGVAIQGNARNVRAGSIWVKNSQGHGVYINAYDVNIGLIQVDGYGNAAIDFTGASYLQDANSEAQSEQGCGVWLNRWTGQIGRIIVGQSNATPAGDIYSVLVDETGKSTSAADRYVSAVIGSIRASVGGNRGICIGEATTPGTFLNVDVGTITAQLRSGKTMTSGYAMVNVSPCSSSVQSKYVVNVRHIDLVDSTAQIGFKATGTSGTGVFTEINIGVLGNAYMLGAGQMAVLDGSAAVGSLRGSIGRIHCNYSAGSGSSPLVDLNKLQSFVLGSCHLYAASSVNTPALRFKDCVDSAVRNVRTENLRNSGSGAVAIDGVTRCTFGPAYLKGASVAGQGIIFSQTIADLSLVDVRVTDFAVGLDNGTGLAMTNCSASNCRSYSNTDDTDLTVSHIATASQFNCVGITA